MSGLATAAAIGVTLASIARLAATDTKRRRAFHLPPFHGRRHAAALAASALAPGVLLLGTGLGAGGGAERQHRQGDPRGDEDCEGHGGVTPGQAPSWHGGAPPVAPGAETPRPRGRGVSSGGP